MLTVLIETWNQESALAQTLAALVAAAVEGLVSEVVVLDHGSTDGSSMVADAAGCKFHTAWKLADVMRSARGDWILIVEPGARLQQGWIDEVMDHVARSRQPARFTLARQHRRPLLKRMMKKPAPLETGLLLPKHLAVPAAQQGADVTKLAAKMRAVSLASELVPARSLQAAG